jgi:hypothetical protein
MVAIPFDEEMKSVLKSGANILAVHCLNTGGGAWLDAGNSLMLNTIIPFGNVGVEAERKFLVIGYDELYSIQYFNTNLKPLLRDAPGATMEGVLYDAAANYEKVMEKCKSHWIIWTASMADKRADKMKMQPR